MSTNPESTDCQERHLTIGMVGLGRMGANLSVRALRSGISVIGFDPDDSSVANLIAQGGKGAASLSDLVKLLPRPRTIWVMVPAGSATRSVITEFGNLLDSGDCIIDGGNSYYRDDLMHSQELSQKGIDLIDVGTSGGVWGLERGFCLMIGGEDTQVKRLEELWNALAPGIESAPRTNDKSPVSNAEQGWLHCGPSGAGHFVKMVHNGIEYGLMAAYAEGLNVLANAGIGRSAGDAEHDAETTPLRDPQYYSFDIDVAEVTEVWRRGSVISSWLLDLTAAALHADPTLDGFEGRVSDSGEGRWTAIAAIDEGVPTPVLTAALHERFSSRGNAEFADKALSAMRKQFGGHDEKA